ncbi:Crp/Fnr family transcriptional regulator [Hyphococcus flavus]|uniref:Crp/Fnr family transcriptional regulator n=1 Tax=Hyphococcus flavus TaxID=1866326 RepID=A0AAF0CG80_9PROT|nr:Crp/Fnr family transcriptional regulator [Hyphococcus flavus]WDI33191.1 Crp/Fnr family transcriptional regulator [Hyphococcus flavus]
MSAATINSTNPTISDDNIANALGATAPFVGLPGPVLSLLSEKSERKSYGAGQTVFSLGQYDGGEFLIVLSGSLRVSITDGETGAMIIEEVNEQEIFGLEIAMAEIDQAMFQQIAVNAATECDIVVMDAAEFKSLAGGRPSLMRNIAIYLAQKLAAHRLNIETTQAAPEQRVYAALLKCVARDPVDGLWRIEKMPKHRELADQAGVDEAAAAGAVAALIQEGVAHRDYPGLIVNDMSRLNQLAS